MTAWWQCGDNGDLVVLSFHPDPKPAKGEASPGLQMGEMLEARMRQKPTCLWDKPGLKELLSCLSLYRHARANLLGSPPETLPTSPKTRRGWRYEKKCPMALWERRPRWARADTRSEPCCLVCGSLGVVCSIVEPCCLLLLLGDAPGKAELPYHVNAQDVSSTCCCSATAEAFAVYALCCNCCQLWVGSGPWSIG